MFWVPNKLVFLTTPRCASRTISQALSEQADAIAVGHTYHPPMETVRLAHQALSEPFWAIIRDPVQQILSYWWNAYGDPVMNILPDAQDPIPFDEYIPRWKTGDRWPRLNIYADFADNFYPMNAGIAGFFAAVGLPEVKIDRPIDTIGETVKTAVEAPIITNHTISVMWDTFPDDMSLWTGLKQKFEAA